MKLTLLQYVQSILSSLNSDEVNSISDNPESMQVAEIVRTTYFNIIGRTHLPEHKQLIQLNPSLDDEQPVVMTIPDGIGKIEWIKYFNSNVTQTPPGTTTHGVNTDVVPTPAWTTTSTTSITVGTGAKTFTVDSAILPATEGQGVVITSNIPGATMNGVISEYTGTTMIITVTSTAGSGTYSDWTIMADPALNIAPPGYIYVTIIPIQQFLDITNSYNPTENDVRSFVFTDEQAGFPGTYTFYYKNDSQPTYCTVLNDHYVIFDSYDATQDSTLQASKTMCYGEIIPYWTMTDTFIPNIDDNQVPLLLNEAKSLAFFEMKQTSHAKAEQEARRQWSSVQKDKARIDTRSDFDKLPDFGRNARGGGFATPSYFKLRGWDRP